MQRPLVILVLMALTACAGSRRREPTAAELEAICQERRCRPPTTLKIPITESQTYVVDFPASPWIAGPGLISLLPGETITITGTVDDEGHLQDLQVVDNTSESAPNTIVLEFEPPRFGRMTLYVHNNFDQQVVYEIAMFVPMEDGLFSSTAVPVFPGGKVVELWPHPITQLALSRFRFEPATPR